MTILFWLCLWFALAVEVGLGAVMLVFGWTHGQPACLAIGLLFIFPVMDTVKGLRCVPWRKP